jgi:superfamily I DNA/RNA helicase
LQEVGEEYIGRYIVEQIEQIPADDIAESHEQGYPTVLVVGPKPYRGAAYDVIREHFPQAALRESSGLTIELLDGYRLLAKDESDRLGWRIVIECDPFPGSGDVLTEVARDELELVELPPEEYLEKHLEVARLVRQLHDGEAELTDAQAHTLVAAVALDLEAIRHRLRIAEERESDPEADAEGSADATPDDDHAAPSIICTSLISSKGLSAGYVFIVGFNNGALPRHPHAVTDGEVCQFLVGLSRTRKECHVVSVGRLGADWVKRSSFARWIAEQTETVDVNAAYFQNSS